MNPKLRAFLIYGLGGALVALAYLAYLNEKAGHRVEIEGLYLDNNFRDVGASINSCAKSMNLNFSMKESRLLRANKWFSGWSCENVSNPDVIVTLNYQPKRNWQYFCRSSNGDRLVAYHGNPKFEINNIEYLETWAQTDMRKAICNHLDVIFRSVANNEKTLFHCEAGRDRTGAVAALSSALAMEQAKVDLTGAALDTIECDYRKSHSLREHKYGRMAQFLSAVKQKSGSVHKFLADQCEMEEDTIRAFSTALLP